MKIDVVPTRGEWPLQFAQERRLLESILGPLAIAVEHIGSTSVPDLAAKPVLDIQVALTSLADFDASDVAERLASHGYVHRTDLQPLVPYRRFFMRKDPAPGPAANVHMIEATHPWNDRQLLFRDYLRQTPHARDRYQALKQSLSGLEWSDVMAYNAAKQDLIWQLEDEAFDHFGLDDAQKARVRSSRVT